MTLTLNYRTCPADLLQKKSFLTYFIFSKQLRLALYIYMFFYINEGAQVLVASFLNLSHWLFRQGWAVLNTQLPKQDAHPSELWICDVSNHRHCAARVLGVVVLFLIGIFCVICYFYL